MDVGGCGRGASQQDGKETDLVPLRQEARRPQSLDYESPKKQCVGHREVSADGTKIRRVQSPCQNKNRTENGCNDKRCFEVEHGGRRRLSNDGGVIGVHCSSFRPGKSALNILTIAFEMGEKVNDDVVSAIFDVVTGRGDWPTRLNMLLVFPNLRQYSKTVTHMRVVLNRWHMNGCGYVQLRMARTMPISLSRDWLDHIIKRTHRTRKAKPCYFGDMSCTVCGRTWFPCTTM